MFSNTNSQNKFEQALELQGRALEICRSTPAGSPSLSPSPAEVKMQELEGRQIQQARLLKALEDKTYMLEHEMGRWFREHYTSKIGSDGRIHTTYTGGVRGQAAEDPAALQTAETIEAEAEKKGKKKKAKKNKGKEPASTEPNMAEASSTQAKISTGADGLVSRDEFQTYEDSFQMLTQNVNGLLRIQQAQRDENAELRRRLEQKAAEKKELEERVKRLENTMAAMAKIWSSGKE